jgi:hypothetical protein
MLEAAFMTLLNLGTSLGLIVRGKESFGHSPGVMEQHADSILADGSPVGFFGLANPGFLYSSGSSNSIGLGMAGDVFYYQDFIDNGREAYVSGTAAQNSGLISAVLLVPATLNEQMKFKSFWTNKNLHPGKFHLLGKNCSTTSSLAFEHAGILTTGIPGLDTPDNLFRHLARIRPSTAHYGYLGFEAVGSGYSVTCIAADDARQQGTSSARSSQSQSSGSGKSSGSSARTSISGRK